MISGLEQLLNEYPLKICYKKNRNEVLIYNSNDIYPEDCVKLCFQNNEYNIYEVHRATQIIRAKEEKELYALIKIYMFCLRFFSIKIFSSYQLDCLAKKQNSIKNLYNSGCVSEIENLITSTLYDINISFWRNEIDGLSLIEDNGLYMVNVNGYTLYKNNDLNKAYCLIFNIGFKISYLCTMLKEKFNIENYDISLINIYVFGTQFYKDIPKPL